MKHTKGILRKAIAMLLMGVMVATTVPTGILDVSAAAEVYAVEKEDDLSLSQTSDESTAQGELSEQTDEEASLSESETLSDEEQDSATEATDEIATEDETESEAPEDESITEETSEELTEVSEEDAATDTELLGEGEAVAKVKTADGEQSFTSFDDAARFWMEKGDGAELVLLDDVRTEYINSVSQNGSVLIKVVHGTEEAPMILDLNDHGIFYAGEASDMVIKVEIGCFFELRDSSSTQTVRYIKINDGGRATEVVTEKPDEGENYVQISGGYLTGGHDRGGIENLGTFTMNGGTICGNDTVGIYNSTSATFIMNGGKIRDNNGCGVQNANRFEMNGGEISDNNGIGVKNNESIFSPSFTMNGGEISRNHGCGVYNFSDSIQRCSFTMNGGKISGNIADKGGGVYSGTINTYYSASFTMTGGEISGNTATSNGGGVYIGSHGNAPFTMTGGEISGNTATEFGGGICIDNDNNLNDVSFIIDGGKIIGNSAKYGGGVSLCKALDDYQNVKTISLKMNDGTICENTATADGGGVYIKNYDYGEGHDGVLSFELTGGSISGNIASGNAGGVYNLSASFTMSGGEISGNSAYIAGGVRSERAITGNLPSFTLSGGKICGNTAAQGGGVVSNYGTVAMSGGEISGNTTEDGRYQAVLRSNKTITFDGTILAGTAVDGSDAHTVTASEVNGAMVSYGYIKVIEVAVVKTSDTEQTFGYFADALSFWQEKGAAGAGAELMLLTDFKTDSKIEINGGTEDAPMVLDLNGNGILYTGGSGDCVISIASGKFFELKDSGDTETVRYIKLGEFGRGTAVAYAEPDEGDYLQISGGYIAGGQNCGVLNNGTLTMNGGTICGNYSMNGGGVVNKGAFIMNAGAICGNNANYDAGGGVYNTNNGTLAINGGEISGNTAKQKGGGVCNEGTLTISGGEISENTATNEGGGIYNINTGTLTMSGGEISNNTATDGKAVFNYEGTIAFDGSVCAGIATDGTDSKYVAAEDAVNDINTYGFITMSNLWHAPVENMTYTGSALVPEVKVYFGQRLLREKTDYTIKFTNNVKAGTEAKFTITGKGNYKGTISDTFEIVAKKISDVEVSVSAIAPAAYNKKKAYTPVPAITYNKKKLKKGTDFTVEYFSDEACNTKVTPKDGGKYYAKVTGIKNFTDSVVLPFEIAGSEQIAVSKLTIGKIPAQSYTGEALTPSLTIKNGKKELTSEEKEDIVIQYENNTKIGTATVIIAGKEGSKFVGKRTVTFQIAGILMNKVTVAGIPKKAVVYDGTEQKPAITLSYKANKKSAEQEIKCATQEQYDKELSADEQAEIGCIVSYANNKNVGTATVTLTGIHGCSGTVKKTFKITPFVVTNNEEDPFKVEAVPPCPYAKGGAKPVPVVTYKEIKLTEGVDYTVSYANNTAINDGTGNKKPTVKVTGKGNFKGTDSSTTFAIVTADMGVTGVKVSANDVVFQNKAGKWKAKYTVAGPDGKALKAGTDYDKINVEYAYDEDFNEPITDSIVPAGKTIYMRVTAKGSSYSGTATGSYRILAAGHDISKLSVKIDPKEYTGREIRLTKSDIIWKSGKKAVENVDFVIDGSTYTNNIGKGTATVIVRGIGEWGGSKKITYKINAHGLKWWQKFFS